MKTPDGYLHLHQKRLPILQKMRELQRELDAMDAPIIEAMAQSGDYAGWVDPMNQARIDLQKLHKKHSLK